MTKIGPETVEISRNIDPSKALRSQTIITTERNSGFKTMLKKRTCTNNIFLFFCYDNILCQEYDLNVPYNSKLLN